ncbi:MAG: ABC transporter ATP-binding protein [Trueperaceae bacterium]|nr:ABC transporter ATP-binding protein [Trueperaceae bacterium]
MIDRISKRYGRTLALDDVSLEVGQNEMFALLGPNGAGKTTLMHILCTIHRPDSGSARISGVDVVRQPLRARKHLGVVFQEPSLDDRLTALENLEFHGLIFGVPRATRQKRIDELLSLVELSKWRDRPVRALSVGMKRRLEIARALVHDSRLLVLDEPTVGLDAQSRERVWDYLGQLRSWRDISILVSTHYIHEVEGCDRVCVIDHGKVLALDSVAGLKASFGKERLKLRAESSVVQEIAGRFGVSVESSDGELALEVDGDAQVADVLAVYGSRLTSMTRVGPSLESVFLTLTGRELRETEADPRSSLLQFAKSGGEHTR